MSSVELLESSLAKAFYYEKVMANDTESNNYYPALFASRVSAGFPSPADEYVEGKLDINKYLVSNPPATFFVRATGDSMIGAGIYSGDVLIVDRSIEPKEGKIVIAAVDGNLAVKRFAKANGKIILKSENRKYSDIVIHGDIELVIWGVVTCVLHRV